ncbi:glycosyltransferase [Hymenobacter psoromatis]|uniref:glycosyltransferase n=1 Tax=Hymenobacter psoromatis TaxID=1484116 RepID=UPI001CBAD40D|nr:glycosyltransferase [Hymenobacter psoromatis]
MRIVLIGNYQPDGQESMRRFADMLVEGFGRAGLATETWLPTVFFGALVRQTTSGLGKWLGYLDKWVLFPLVLRWRTRGTARADHRFHICDHSNAPYLPHLPAAQTGITCHDVLAIRGGLGYADAYVAASRMGRVLQAWILGSLRRAERLAAVSHFTLGQLNELTTPATPAADWRVIHNAFNARFWPMPADQAAPLLRAAGLDLNQPFLLHVGSDLPRKNRALLLEMAAALGSRWAGLICFAGAPLEPALLARAEALGLRQRVVAVASPAHETLVALYSTCAAFVFPSYSEGFGWPVIEAQACGAPVLVSSVAPMPEVSGGAARHADPDDAPAFAAAFLDLLDGPTRQALVQAGLANCQRFEPAAMTAAYLDLLAIPVLTPSPMLQPASL